MAAYAPLADVIDEADANKLPAAIRDARVGSLLAAGNGARLFGEKVPALANVATPTFPIAVLLGAVVSGGTGGNGGKTADPNGATVAANQAAPNAAGTSVAFFAGEVTGASAAVTLYYITTSPPVDSVGKVAISLVVNDAGLFP